MDETEATTSEMKEPPFSKVLSTALEAAEQGRMPTEMLLRLIRSHEPETLQYCIQRLTAPNLSPTAEATISNLLKQAGMVRQLVESLLSLDPESAKALAKTFQATERSLDMKVAAYLES